MQSSRNSIINYILDPTWTLSRLKTY
jgi:hypothetical protein